jgi:hypothetical protein
MSGIEFPHSLIVHRTHMINNVFLFQFIVHMIPPRSIIEIYFFFNYPYEQNP